MPTFDEEMANFPTRWKKLLACATATRIKSVVKEVREPLLPEKEISEIDETTEQGKWASIAVNQNDLAVASFSMDFTTEKSMNIIYTDCTPE